MNGRLGEWPMAKKLHQNSTIKQNRWFIRGLQHSSHWKSSIALYSAIKLKTLHCTNKNNKKLDELFSCRPCLCLSMCFFFRSFARSLFLFPFPFFVNNFRVIYKLLISIFFVSKCLVQWSSVQCSECYSASKEIDLSYFVL